MYLVAPECSKPANLKNIRKNEPSRDSGMDRAWDSWVGVRKRACSCTVVQWYRSTSTIVVSVDTGTRYCTVDRVRYVTRTVGQVRYCCTWYLYSRIIFDCL
jgi:hypothetical protein